MFTSLPKRLVGIVAALFLLVPVTIATSPSASAFQPYSISVGTSNSLAKAVCTFKVSSYNQATGTVTGRLIGSIGPRTLFSGTAIATVYVYCNVSGYWYGYDEMSRLANGSSTSFNKQVTLPYNPSFQVCAYGATISKAGVTSSMPVNCS